MAGLAKEKTLFRRSVENLKSGYRVFLFGTLFLFWSCSDDYLLDLGAETLPRSGTWLVDESFIQWGCPGKDCIPSLTKPDMVQGESVNLSYLDDKDLVVGVKKGDETYAFPHPVLDWHEVINMEDYTISYCPLTGSAIHILDDRGFGVSGLLYNSNLIMYDKETNSFWPQMFLKSAAGESRGEDLVLGRMMETTWGTWRKLFPDTYAVSSRTGFTRNYSAYPYGTFRTDTALYFPVKNFDSRLHPKERIVGLLSNGSAKAYQLADFDSVSVVHDTVGGEKFVIFGSSVDNFGMAYKTDGEFSVAAYSIENGEIRFSDVETGSEWNIWGEAVAGPLQGEVLKFGDSFISYWFAWAAFYPETTIWEEQ